jgi:hypothetical protein
MSKLTNITPENFRCTFGACPAVYEDLTPAEHRCEISVSCPAVLRTEGRYVIIGKRLDPEAEGLSGKVGESEAAVEIPAEILLSALGVTESVEAIEKADGYLGKLIDEMLDFLKPNEQATLPHYTASEGQKQFISKVLWLLDGPDGREVSAALRSAIKRAKGGVNG